MLHVRKSVTLSMQVANCSVMNILVKNIKKWSGIYSQFNKTTFVNGIFEHFKKYLYFSHG